MSEAKLIQESLREKTEEFKMLSRCGVNEISMVTVMKILDVANMLADRLVAQEDEIREERVKRFGMYVDYERERLKRELHEIMAKVGR